MNLRKTALLFGCLFHFLGASSSVANERVLAQSLFEQQRYAEAAELFETPMWRGISYYKAEQWGRALEAFARSDHPMARYNLGNSYARMGHYALALESYLLFTKKHPHFEDAKVNADLMREFIRQDSGNDAQQATQPEAKKIEDMPDEHTSAGKGDADSGDDESEKEETPDSKPPKQSPGAHQSKEGTESDKPVPQEQNEQAPQQLESGSPVPEQKKQQADIASKSNDAGTNGLEAGDQFMGIKEKEHQQAIEQWLLKLKHDPARFLKARIEQEKRRRSDAGTLAEPSESKW